MTSNTSTDSVYPGAVSSAMLSAPLHDAFSNAIRAARAGDTLAGLKLAQQAYRMAKSTNIPSAEIEALNILAICRNASGAYIEGMAAAMDAFRIAKQIKDPLGTVYAVTTCASGAGAILDTLDISLRMLERCLARAIELKNVPLKVRVHNIRGILLGSLHQFDDAEREYALAMHSINQAGALTPATLVAGNQVHLAVIRATFAGDELRPGLLNTAEKMAEEVFAVARQSGNVEDAARLHYSLGLLRFQQNDAARALDEFRQALALASRIKHRARIIDIHMEMGKVLTAQGRLGEALSVYQTAYNVADGHRPSRLLAEACSRIAEIQNALGDTHEAAHMRSKAKQEFAEFSKQSGNVRRDLETFWKTVEDLPAD